MEAKVEEEELSAPFELQPKGGIEQSLRKLLRGLKICLNGDDEEEIKGVVTRSVLASKPPPTETVVVDHETCNESQTASSSTHISVERSDKAREIALKADQPVVNVEEEGADKPVAAPDKVEGDREVKDSMDPTATIKDRSLGTEAKHEEEAQCGESNGKTVARKGTGCMEVFLVISVVLAAVFASAILNGNADLDLSNLSLDGLGHKALQSLEVHLLESVRDHLNIQDIFKETRAHVESDTPQNDAASAPNQGEVDVAGIKDVDDTSGAETGAESFTEEDHESYDESATENRTDDKAIPSGTVPIPREPESTQQVANMPIKDADEDPSLSVEHTTIDEDSEEFIDDGEEAGVVPDDGNNQRSTGMEIDEDEELVDTEAEESEESASGTKDDHVQRRWGLGPVAQSAKQRESDGDDGIEYDEL